MGNSAIQIPWNCAIFPLSWVHVDIKCQNSCLFYFKSFNILILSLCIILYRFVDPNLFNFFTSFLSWLLDWKYLNNFFPLTYLCLVDFYIYKLNESNVRCTYTLHFHKTCKQRRPWSDAEFCGVWSRTCLFVEVLSTGTLGIKGSNLFFFHALMFVKSRKRCWN